MDDLISRQAALRTDCFGDGHDGLRAFHMYEDYLKMRKYLESLPSAQQWIPCSERLPEDLEEVNVTWVNHSFTKDKPFTASAVYYGGKWYWYSSVCADILAEYGKNDTDEIDDAIEITAWMPMPEPYTERREE